MSDQVSKVESQRYRGADLPDGRSLQGKHGSLERLELKHSGDLYARFQQSPASDFNWMVYEPWPNVNAWTEWFKKRVEATDQISYAVLDSGGVAMGVLSLMRSDVIHGSIEVGSVHFSNDLKQSVLATEIFYLLGCHVFEDLGYRRWEWKCDSKNGPSIRAANRLGFSFEGVFRQHYIVKGKNRDTAWFSMLDKDWPDFKSRFERWLLSSNFDEEGHQILSLDQC